MADACTQMQMYLQSQGIEYDGKMDVEEQKEENETDTMNSMDQVEVEVEDVIDADNLDV